MFLQEGLRALRVLLQPAGTCLRSVFTHFAFFVSEQLPAMEGVRAQLSPGAAVWLILLLPDFLKKHDQWRVGLESFR